MIRVAWCVRCNCERPIGRSVERHRGFCLVCGETFVRETKHGNKPEAASSSGRTRQSGMEARREDQLAQWERVGIIERLRRCNDHPRESYRLDVYSSAAVERLLAEVEAAAELGDPERTVLRCQTLASEVRRAKHHVATYTPDFSWSPPGCEVRVIEDQKGKDRTGRTDPRWSLIRVLMLACHEVEVVEVRRPNEAPKLPR